MYVRFIKNSKKMQVINTEKYFLKKITVYKINFAYFSTETNLRKPFKKKR